MELELFKAIPNLGQFAVLVFVIAFLLKREKENREETRTLAAGFVTEIKALTGGFQDQVKELAAGTRENQISYQRQVKAVTDQHLTLTRETIHAVKQLEMAVRELQDDRRDGRRHGYRDASE